jgi:hypothetical protein
MFCLKHSRSGSGVYNFAGTAAQNWLRIPGMMLRLLERWNYESLPDGKGVLDARVGGHLLHDQFVSGPTELVTADAALDPPTGTLILIRPSVVRNRGRSRRA